MRNRESFDLNYATQVALIMLASTVVGSTQCRAQDVLYPPDAGVINVKAKYGATGDGHTDDTTAITTALEQNVGQYGYGVLYFPDGTYVVSKQLAYVLSNGWWGAYLTLQGQSEANTIIKLMDDCPGFQDPANPTAVIYTASNEGTTDPTSIDYNPDGSGNQGFRNHILNLTIDTGSGNPGAIGIDYMANNNSRINDVTIRSEDSGGVTALNIQRGDPGPMFLSNMTINTFQTAVQVANAYGVWFENLAISGQSVAGINVYSGSVSVEGFTSTNAVPAVQVPGWGGVVSIVNSTFSGGSPSTSAVELGPYSVGAVFVRNASAQGYQSVASVLGVPVPGNSISEWNSAPPVSLFAPAPPTSANLPFLPTPTYNDTNFSDWQNVVTSGAQPNNPTISLSTFDSAPGIQAAIDSGKSTVYFPPGNYMISQTIHIRGAVKRLLFLNAYLIPLNTAFPANQPAIEIDSTASGTVHIDNLGLSTNYWIPSPNGYLISAFAENNLVNNSAGTVVMTNSDFVGYSNTGAAANQTVYLESVYGGADSFANQTVYARSLNPETWSTNSHVLVSGGSLWTMGLKIEGINSSVLTAENGALTEILGLAAGVFADVPASIPMVNNNGSTVSISAGRSNPYAEPGGASDYDVQFQETLDGNTKSLFKSSSGLTPSDYPYGNGSDYPLFVDSPTLGLTPNITGFIATPPIAGSTFTFTVIGTNFDPTKSSVSFSGPGCSAPCSVNTPGSATQVTGSATLTVAGTYTATLTNGTTGLVSAGVSVTVGNAPPAITSFATNLTGPVGGTPFTFSVSGANFDPINSTVGFTGPGCASLCSAGASGTTAQIAGQITLAPGTYQVSVTNGTTGLTTFASTLLVVSSLATFADVAPTAYYAIGASLLLSKNITAGCGIEPLIYCPDQPLTRAQLAIFVIRAVLGSDPAPGSYSTNPYFTDVPQNAFGFSWIQRFHELGFSDGCGGGNYCPSVPVTRDEMAIFMVRARYGSTTAFSFPVAPFFTDVQSSSFGFSSIQRVRQDNIVSGCGSNQYCPGDIVTRGQMAIFIMRAAFNQLLPAGTPVIGSLSQTTIANGTTATVTVIGVNTHFVQGTTIVNNVNGLAAGPVTVLSPTALTVQLTAQPGISQPVPMWVTTNTEDAVLPNGLLIQ